MKLLKHAKEIAAFIKNGDYKRTENGILIHDSIIGRGKYIHSVNGGQDERIDHNLIPAQGIKHFLDSVLGVTAKIPAWYLTVFSGAVTPVANWTAANFTANASEITSTTEGFTNVTRPAWVANAGGASAGVISNTSARAVFNIICTSTLNISGAALLSSNVRGGPDGVLISASRYEIVRVVNSGDAFELGYEVELTDS